MTLLISGGYIVTLDADDRILENGSVLVDGGKIVWVGQGDPPEGLPPPDRTIDATNKLVLPGLVNCHLHSTADFWKSGVDNLSLEPFLLYGHPYTSGLRLSPNEMYLRHMTSAIELIESGVTTALDDTIHMPAPVDADPDISLRAYAESVLAAVNCYEDVGGRAWVTCNVEDQPFYASVPYVADLLTPELRADLDARPFPPTHQLISFVSDLFRDRPPSHDVRVNLATAPLGPGRCTDELLVGMWQLATKYAVPVVSHIQESKADLVLDLSNYGTTGIRHYSDLGILDRRVAVIHGVWTSSADHELIAESGASLVYNPVSNLKLGVGVAPVLQLLKLGAHIALGTDGPTANDSANLFEAMKVGALVQRLWESDFELWPKALDMLRMATLGGAYALGMEDELGSIEVPKRADLVLVDSNTVAYTPFYKPIHQLVYADVGGSVDTVIVEGRVVVEDGRVTTIDRDGVLEEFRAVFKRISPVLADALSVAERYRPVLDEAYRRSVQESVDPHPVMWPAGGHRVDTR